MYPLIHHASEILINYLNDATSNNHPIKVNIAKFANQFTADVSANCIFGLNGNSFCKNPEEAVIFNMGVDLFKATPIIAKFWIILVGLFPSILNIYKLTYVPKSLFNLFCSITKDSIELRQTTNSDQKDFAEHLAQLKSRKNLTDTDLAGHAFTFFFDAFETSGFTLGMTLFELARHPEVQTQLRNEIFENLDENIDFDTAANLPYLEAAINETVRLYPPVANLIKLCTIETELEGIKGHPLKIEAGTSILLPLYSIHRNPYIYTDPDTYNPDRFSPENGGIKKFEDACLYLGFGAGPRTCLGKTFAKTQIKCALAAILRDYEVGVCDETPENIVFDPQQFILKAENEMWIEFKKLNKN